MTGPAVVVDRWYFRPARSWIVQLRDAEGNQVGDAHYVYRRSEAEWLAALLLAQLTNGSASVSRPE